MFFRAVLDGFGDETISVLLPRFEPLTVQSGATRYANCSNVDKIIIIIIIIVIITVVIIVPFFSYFRCSRTRL